jgi:hypothetical protein
MANEQVKPLDADMFALKMLLPNLLSRVGQLDPILALAIQRAFQDAIDQVEAMMAASPRTETRARCRKALARIRKLRAAVVPKSSYPPSWFSDSSFLTMEVDGGSFINS